MVVVVDAEIQKLLVNFGAEHWGEEWGYFHPKRQEERGLTSNRNGVVTSGRYKIQQQSVMTVALSQDGWMFDEERRARMFGSRRV